MPSADIKPVAYRVETERLVIRCWSPKDAPRMRALLDESDEFLRPWIPFMTYEPRTLWETTEWIRGLRADFDRDINYRYPIFSKDEETLIGETGLYTRAGPGAREIGYLLGINSGGRGYALEAAAAMTRVGFEVSGVDRIEIICAPQNEPSSVIPEKLGYTHEATLPRRFTDCDGVIRDSMLWTLYAAGYPDSPAASYQVSAFDCLGGQVL
jgi:RimJ/RimL family protein N-acetyltransferase